MWRSENDTTTISVDANLFENGAKGLRFSLKIGHGVDGMLVYFKPQPNGVASRRKLKTWIYLRISLATACVYPRGNLRVRLATQR